MRYPIWSTATRWEMGNCLIEQQVYNHRCIICNTYDIKRTRIDGTIKCIIMSSLQSSDAVLAKMMHALGFTENFGQLRTIHARCNRYELKQKSNRNKKCFISKKLYRAPNTHAALCGPIFFVLNLAIVIHDDGRRFDLTWVRTTVKKRCKLLVTSNFAIK